MHLLPGRGMPYGPYAPRFIIPFIVDVGDFAGSSPGLWDSTLTDLEHRRCLRNVDDTSKMQLPSRDEHEGRGHRLKCPPSKWSAVPVAATKARLSGASRPGGLSLLRP